MDNTFRRRWSVCRAIRTHTAAPISATSSLCLLTKNRWETAGPCSGRRRDPDSSSDPKALPPRRAKRRRCRRSSRRPDFEFDINTKKCAGPAGKRQRAFPGWVRSPPRRIPPVVGFRIKRIIIIWNRKTDWSCFGYLLLRLEAIDGWKASEPPAGEDDRHGLEEGVVDRPPGAAFPRRAPPDPAGRLWWFKVS